MNSDQRTIPYFRIVVFTSFLAILGYAGFSIWIIWKFPDATMVGDIIGTWKSFAVLAFGFWLGSSSGGKAQTSNPTGQIEDPVHTKEERNVEVDYRQPDSSGVDSPGDSRVHNRGLQFPERGEST